MLRRSLGARCTPFLRQSLSRIHHSASRKDIDPLYSRLQCRNASSIADLDKLPAIGEEIFGFTVKEKKCVPELHLSAILLQHDKTGADYLHVAREDKNNVFGIGFKTNPPDATGVPHILEHTTLCGSKKSVFVATL
jgi:hypothetical protein